MSTKNYVNYPIDTYSKMFSSFLVFIDRIRGGQKAIIFSKDYVVISRAMYDEYWNERKERMKVLGLDE